MPQRPREEIEKEYTHNHMIDSMRYAIMVAKAYKDWNNWAWYKKLWHKIKVWIKWNL